MKLTVAIVTWNSGKFMRSCLEGLKDQTFKNFELLIVDNNSSDNTINIVRSEYPTAKIIINKDNLGFCGGHNIGIKNSIGEYYMPYNPDIIADENFLYKMLEAIELEDDIGSVSGKLLRYDLKNNCKTNIIDSTGIYFKKNRRSLDRGAEEVDVGQYEDAQYVFGPSGAAPLYRRSMLESIKLDNQYFNENFFAYREDVDLAWRAQLKGWKSIYYPEAIAFHVRNNTPEKRKQMTEFVNMHSVKNRMLMLLQNESILGLIRDGFIFILYDLMIITYVLLKERTSYPALKYIFRNRKEIINTRRKIIKGATVSSSEMLKWFGRVKFEDLKLLNQKQNVFIIGSKGIPAQYGGFETFVEQLTARQVTKNISYHVSCLSKEKSEDFLYNGVRCFNISVPEIGGAKAVLYDLKSLKSTINFIRKYNVKKPIIYILACRIGPFYPWYKFLMRKLNVQLLVNPDGHEWKRSKWSLPIRTYWKLSEKYMVKSSDLLICDSLGIEDYIKSEYKKYNPNTMYISYGADISQSKLESDSKLFLDWMSKHSLHSNEYYLIVGRFVPENNYEFIIREFMKSETRRNLIIISNVEQNKFFDELKSKTNFTSDDRIKFVGTVYDTELLKKIREQAFGYLHGHEVGGTNPSLLEALASTNLNILLGVNFNVEVGRNAALYFTKNTGSLTALIGEAENLDEDTIIEFGKSAKQEIISRYSWEHIVYSYENLFLHFHSSDKENIKFQNEMDLINFNKKQLKIEG